MLRPFATLGPNRNCPIHQYQQRITSTDGSIWRPRVTSWFSIKSKWRCFVIIKWFLTTSEEGKKKNFTPNVHHHSMQNPNQPPYNANVVLKYGVPGHASENEREDVDLLASHPVLVSRRTLTVVLGEEMTGAHDHHLLSHINRAALVPNIDALQIIAHKDIWTPEREQRIQGHHPSFVAVVTRVITPDKGIETTVAKYDDGELTTSSASIPIDQLSDTTIDEILDLPGLDILILLPPQNATSFTQMREFQRKLLRALCTIKTLKKAVVPLDLFTCVRDVIEELKKQERLTSLELAMPSTFDLLTLDPTFHRLLEVELLAVLEPFPQLEELIVGRDLLASSELFVEMTRRMFNTQVESLDGQTVCFGGPARDLIYGKSVLQLEGVIP